MEVRRHRESAVQKAIPVFAGGGVWLAVALDNRLELNTEILNDFYYVYLLCACLHICTHVTVQIQKSEDNLLEPVFSFHQVGPGDGTQELKLIWWQAPLPDGPSQHTPSETFKFKSVCVSREARSVGSP